MNVRENNIASVKKNLERGLGFDIGKGSAFGKVMDAKRQAELDEIEMRAAEKSCKVLKGVNLKIEKVTSENSK